MAAMLSQMRIFGNSVSVLASLHCALRRLKRGAHRSLGKLASRRAVR